MQHLITSRFASAGAKGIVQKRPLRRHLDHETRGCMLVVVVGGEMMMLAS